MLRKLREGLKNKKEKLTDEELLTFLKKQVDKSVAQVMEDWDRDTVKYIELKCL